MDADSIHAGQCLVIMPKFLNPHCFATIVDRRTHSWCRNSYIQGRPSARKSGFNKNVCWSDTWKRSHKLKNLTQQGAYVLAEAEGKRQVILIATGSEVEVALAARAALQEQGIGTRVVSMPCMELFAAQDDAYRKRVLPGGPVRVGVEAAIRQGWDRWLLGQGGREQKAGFVGMDSFGASAPAETLFEKFGITAEAVAQKVKSLL